MMNIICEYTTVENAHHTIHLIIVLTTGVSPVVGSLTITVPEL